MPQSAIDPRIRRQARALRREPTDAERKLWQILRSLRPLGFHFRRQAPIGNYIADFVWHTGELIIEVDGGQHAEMQQVYDERRTAWLQSQGYRVVRFWNNEVLKSPNSVGEAVLLEANKAMALALTSPTPDPSPQGGGEKKRSAVEGNVR